MNDPTNEQRVRVDQAEQLMLAIRALDKRVDIEGIGFVHEYIDLVVEALTAAEARGMMRERDRLIPFLKHERDRIPIATYRRLLDAISCQRPGTGEEVLLD